jgi:hypothetical protein
MKVKGVQQHKNTWRTQPEHDFLKYWRVVRFWVKKKYGLGTPDLEMLLFLYSEQIFNKEKFKEFEYVMAWDVKRFKQLLTDDYIHVWRKRTGSEATLYELTYRSKRIINTVYKKLNGEEISELPATNPLFKKNLTYMEEANRSMIVKMNAEIKKPTS